MADSYDSLKDLPRVPKSDSNGVQEGRGAAPKKRYRSNGAVDMAEAVSLFNKRKSGEIPIIQGGLDDEDPRLYDETAKITSSLEQVKVAQSRALTDDDVARIKGDEPEAGQPQQLVRYVAAPAPKPRRKGRQPAQDGVQIVERVVEKPVEKIVEKVVEKPVETVFSKWRSQRVRVGVSLPDTTFNISAVSVVRSLCGITVFLPTSDDAMTFIPKTGARVGISVGQDPPVDTVYTGVSFDIPELGILGLCFIVPDSGKG